MPAKSWQVQSAISNSLYAISQYKGNDVESFLKPEPIFELHIGSKPENHTLLALPVLSAQQTMCIYFNQCSRTIRRVLSLILLVKQHLRPYNYYIQICYIRL